MIIAKWLKADFNLSLLLSVGTGICGAAAIAAVSPIIKAKDEDGYGCRHHRISWHSVFNNLYVNISFFINWSYELRKLGWNQPTQEIGHVALAAAPAGQDALAHALLAKLTEYPFNSGFALSSCFG